MRLVVQLDPRQHFDNVLLKMPLLLTTRNCRQDSGFRCVVCGRQYKGPAVAICPKGETDPAAVVTITRPPPPPAPPEIQAERLEACSACKLYQPPPSSSSPVCSLVECAPCSAGQVLTPEAKAARLSSRFRAMIAKAAAECLLPDAPKWRAHSPPQELTA